MARTITDEEIRLNIVINGNEAQRELHQLERNTIDLKEANKALNAEKRRLEAQGQRNTQRYRELTAEIARNNATIDTNRTRMNELQNQLGITGQTMAQLRQRATVLRNALSNMVPGSADFVRVQGELSAITARLGELSGRAVTARSAIAALADGFNRYAALGASVFGVLTGMVLSIQKVIDLNGKLSDAQANVQKTTGMTKEEVDELTKSFSQLNTRTSKIDLLGIAEVGGQLGIAKGDIGEFVEVMNKAGVALGKSFEGGVTAVAEKLGKIKGLYAELGDVSIKTAFESVGSAMNELAAQGTATEENIADFVTRVGAMPEVLKPSIEQSLGLAAAFEETGLKAEIAGTNYSKVISIAAKSSGDFAKVMKMSKKEVEDLINSDPNEFFLKFAESLKGMNAVDLSKTLDALKLNDNEVKMVLGAASQNTDLFRKKIDLANVSMAEATSLTKEYEIMNNTLQATLEKVYKKMTGIFTSEALVKFLLGAVTWFAKLIGVTEDTTGRFAVLRTILVNLAKVFAIVVASTLSYKAALMLVNNWTRTVTAAQSLYNLVQTRGTVVTNLLKSSQLLLSSAYYLVTGNTTRATAAMRLFNITTKLNPLGLLLGLITAVATAFVLYKNRANEATIASNTLTDLQFTVQRNIDAEKNKLYDLLAIARDETLSKQRRKEAIDAINKISPEYLNNLTLENIKTAEASRAVDRYIQSLNKKAMAEVLASKRQEYQDKIFDSKNDPNKNKLAGKYRYKDLYETEQKILQNLTEDERKFWNVKTRNIDDSKAKTELLSKVMGKLNKEERERAEYLKATGGFNNSYTEYRSEIGNSVIALKVLNEEQKKFFEQNPSEFKKAQNQDVNPDNTGTPAPSSNPNSNQETAEQRKQRIENERKQREDMLKQMTADELLLAREAKDAKIALMAEGFEKEMAQEKENHDRKIDDLQKQLISESEIQAALKKANNEKLSQDERAFFQKQADYWIAENKHRNTLIESEDAQHLYRKNTIATKYDTERIKKLEEQYNREKTVREASYQEEIAGKNLTEEQLKIAREEFDKAEIEQYRNHINNVIAELQKLIAVKKLALQQSIVPEESAVYQQQIDSLQALIDKMNELATAKNNVKNGGGGEGAFQGNDLLSGMGGQTDIFGFSPDHWKKMFENLENGKIGVGEIATAVRALSNVWQQYGQIVNNNENQQLKNYENTTNKRKKTLKQALDNGWISQKEYNERVEKIDQDLAEKKAKIEHDQAVRARDYALMNIAINTAAAVMKIWAEVPKADFGISTGILTALAVATGALQMAAVASAPLPSEGFEEGYYPVKRQQDGKVFNAKRGGIAKSGMVNRPTHFLAGENGQFFPEMIIDGKSFKNFSPELKENLYNELNGIRGFEKGYNRQIDNRQIDNRLGNSIIDNGNSNLALEMLIKENVAILREIKEEGILAVVSDKDFLSIDKLNKAQDRLRNIKEKTKVVG